MAHTRSCPRCGNRYEYGPGARQHRWCRACFAKYMREHRKGPEGKRDRARSAARRAVLRGELVRGPCEGCGQSEVEAHHPDYSRPLEVEWLCRPCHVQRHVAERRAA